MLDGVGALAAAAALFVRKERLLIAWRVWSRDGVRGGCGGRQGRAPLRCAWAHPGGDLERDVARVVHQMRRRIWARARPCGRYSLLHVSSRMASGEAVITNAGCGKNQLLAEDARESGDVAAWSYTACAGYNDRLRAERRSGGERGVTLRAGGACGPDAS
jgi:hypothetical protein